MIRRYVLPIALPAAVIGGYIVTGSIGGLVNDAWEDFLGPFLITYWIGFGFTLTWDYIREAMHVDGASPTLVAITGVFCALVILAMIGFDTLLSDPWLFGVAVAPGFRLAGPWLQKQRAVKDEGSA